MKGPGNQTRLFFPLNSGCLSLTLKDKTRRAGKHMQMHTCERKEDKGTDRQEDRNHIHWRQRVTTAQARCESAFKVAVSVQVSPRLETLKYQLLRRLICSRALWEFLLTVRN